MKKSSDPKLLKHKRRLCQVEGCPRIVKSQGRCQRHGAKPKSCKVVNCAKQAQGNFDGMCKSHFHETQRAQLRPMVTATLEEDELVSSSYCQVITPPPSVYDTVLPASIRWSVDSGGPMPLIDYLKDNFDRGTAWHRNDERLARGLPMVSSPAVQLEGWERELVWTETLLLTGTADASFRHLARGWGRDKGFHRVLAQSICERHGNVERKPAAVNTPISTMMTTTLPPSVGYEHYCTPIVAESVSSSSCSASSSSSDTSAVTSGQSVWDGACYYELEYNERLASELMLDLVEEEPYVSDDSVVPFANLESSESN